MHSGSQSLDSSDPRTLRQLYPAVRKYHVCQCHHRLLHYDPTHTHTVELALGAQA